MDTIKKPYQTPELVFLAQGNVHGKSHWTTEFRLCNGTIGNSSHARKTVVPPARCASGTFSSRGPS
jgi:hypothetical protein